MSTAVIAVLRRVEIFNGLGDKELSQIAQLCKIGKAKKGQVIFREDSDGEELYIVHDGAVELVPLSDGSYAARIDEAAVRVTPDPAANTWRLHDRTGRDYVFGASAAARVGPASASFTTTFAWHRPSLRVMEKLGMIQIGIDQHDTLGELLVFEVRK